MRQPNAQPNQAQRTRQESFFLLTTKLHLFPLESAPNQTHSYLKGEAHAQGSHMSHILSAHRLGLAEKGLY